MSEVNIAEELRRQKIKLADLDRCEHGRHSIDDCVSCPDGWSTGNTFLKNGQRIGTDYAGNPIHVATRRSLRDGSDHPLDRGIGSFPIDSNEEVGHAARQGEEQEGHRP